MFRTLITSIALAFCLSLPAQTELVMGEYFGEENIDQISEWEQEGFTLTPNMAANPKEKEPCYKAKNKEVRMYALNTLTIKAPDGMEMTEIVFSLSKQGVEEQAIVLASSGEVATQEIGSKKISWTGETNEITFTVGETNSLHPEGVADGSGQLDFTSIKIKTQNATDGTADLLFDDSPSFTTEYYDVTGKKVTHPKTGFYLCKQGKHISKIYIR